MFRKDSAKGKNRTLRQKNKQEKEDYIGTRLRDKSRIDGRKEVKKIKVQVLDLRRLNIQYSQL